MSTRLLAPPLLSFVVAVLLGGLLCLPVGCTWEPIAHTLQPELLLAGPARVAGLVDAQGHHAIVELGLGADMRRQIVDVEQRTSCALPAGARPVGLPLYSTSQPREGKVVFLQPLVQGEGVEGKLADLWYTDEKCQLRGPFGAVSSDPQQISLRADGRAITLVQGEDNNLRIVDPWTNAVRPIANSVTGFASVQQPDGTTAPEALWLIESGKLTQRALDGTLLVAIGSRVSGFQQLLSDQLRVTYRDGSDVFEAKGPDFTPVLIAEDACRPAYNGRSLELRKPCADDQLVRIDLTTGEIKTFTKGVYDVYQQGDVSFELQHAPEGNEVWVSVLNVRTQLLPSPRNAISALDREHVAGRTEDGRFGIWSVTQPFAVGYQQVQDIKTFRDRRTNRLLWLMFYEVVGDVGKLALFEQTDLERVTVGLPAGTPTMLSEQVQQYELFDTGVLPEPIVLSLDAPITKTADGETFQGTLYARYLSGSLGAKIDDGVSSSKVTLVPVPGVLYGILEGPKSGLWFATL
jgi:hypothetical protein